MTVKRTLAYASLGLLIYLIFLVATVPANWLAWGINKASNGKVALSETRNTLWRGTGRLLVYYPHTQPHDLGRATWRLSPWHLLTGGIHLELTTLYEETRLSTEIGFRRGALRLDETSATLPAKLLGSFYAPATLAAPKGEIHLTSKRIEITPEAVTGSAEIIWRNAGSRFSGARPLGDYRLTLTGKDKGATLKLETLKGDLELLGNGQWDVLGSGMVRLKGSARPRTDANRLEPFLRLMGQDQGGGKRKLMLNTRLLLHPKGLPGF